MTTATPKANHLDEKAQRLLVNAKKFAARLAEADLDEDTEEAIAKGLTAGSDAPETAGRPL